MKYRLALVLCLLLSSLLSMTIDDVRFCLDHELFYVIKNHESELSSMILKEPQDRQTLQTILEYAQRTDNLELATLCHQQLAYLYRSLEDALQWISLSDYTVEDSLSYEMTIGIYKNIFSTPSDSLILNSYLRDPKSSDYLRDVPKLDSYNSVIESLAKGIIDDISVEPSDSLAQELIESFYVTFPRSSWRQAAYYYQLYHLANAKDYDGMLDKIALYNMIDPSHAYISSIFLSSPSFRKNYLEGIFSPYALQDAVKYLDRCISSAIVDSTGFVLYDHYDGKHWQNKLKLQQVKLTFYQLLQEHKLYGDEEDFISITGIDEDVVDSLASALKSLRFANNDAGEQAEKFYWLGRVLALSNKIDNLKRSVCAFNQSLIYGSPRKRYDIDDWKYISKIHDRLGIRTDAMTWIRDMKEYDSIIFSDQTESSGFNGERYSRVALGDYDNDGRTDILFNGNKLYRNIGKDGFIKTDNGLQDLDANGGLFADFNQDGCLDMMNTSNSDTFGEQLMKNMHNERFVNVSERAGDIYDRYPTEGAAWVDPEMDGFPDIYVANYEKWQVQSGYPDYYWQNIKGYFTDMSDSLGFRTPPYTKDPGQAGRGVAPADFDNDGMQEIYVTNYRLNRNFCWKKTDKGFVDVAPLYNLQGKYKNGYYGHSIGADWGDYDNDGDLDLFITNLAHPRYIDISDVSALYRNDGLTYRVIDADTLYYWQFTDVTKESGITYDELHSDPLWIDADNDGLLDLFITSVYENDRSYLYRNNGDGTFTDITWLSGARVYNGWGNACADLDRDGLLDLVVGSGNGTKLLMNRTKTANRSVTVKPVWTKKGITLLDDVASFSKYPNSPAYGARVIVEIKDRNGKKHKLMRELSSAKGTTSQNAQELHFGIGSGKVLKIKLSEYENNKN